MILASSVQNFTDKVLTGSNATKTAIINAISDMVDDVDNTCVFHFSGHGGTDPYHLATSSSDITPSDLSSAFGSHKKFCCYLDACHSGGFCSYSWPSGAGEIYAACKSNEDAIQGANGGYFTQYCIEKLNKVVGPTAKDVYDYARPRVRDATKSYEPYPDDNWVYPQNPTKKDNYSGDIYIKLSVPVADFSADNTIIDAGETVLFSDNSTQHPDKYFWTFSGGSPSSSTIGDPTVSYNTGGQYQVSFTAINTAGSDTETKTAYIKVIPSPPTYLTVTGNIGLNPYLSWTGSQGATFYKIYRKGYYTSPTYKYIGSTSNTDYIDYEVMIEDPESGDDKYYYQVTALLSTYGESDPSNPAYIWGETFERREISQDSFSESQSSPLIYSIQQNYPNPANPTTTIEFTLPESGEVSLVIYNLRGQVIKTLINGSIQAGVHYVVWDGKDTFGNNIPSGLYIYRLKAGRRIFTRKLTLME